MRNYKDHLIPSNSKILQALEQLDFLARDAILFVVDSSNKLLGSLTDGDVRRGLLKNVSVDDMVDDIIQPNPKYLRKGEYEISQILDFKSNDYVVIPIVNKKNQVINIINFKDFKSYLPVDAVIMAGGKGSRLSPLTDTIPKPLLKVGDKPIIEHNIERLTLYGIDDFWLSINYLGNQLVEYFGDGQKRSIQINYVEETKPLGTIGSLSLIEEFSHDYILLTNSDILTDLDYEHFFLEFARNKADLSVVTIPYKVDIPYAVLETGEGGIINDFKEKPTYTYFSNGGIYLMKKSVVDLIPKGVFYNATDLMGKMIKQGMKVTSYPLMGYWLDIGKHEDFRKAQEDIKHIKF